MIRAMHLRPANTLEEAMQMARRLAGAEASVNVIPDGVSVIV